MAEVKAPLFAGDGTAKGDVSLDADIFGIEPNMAVMHQVVTAQMAGARRGTAKTKTRAEVRGGGRKPWRQKGLGRARHGSIRAPQWVGGGTVFGPQPRDYSQRTNKKMKRLALRSALSARASEGAVKIIDDLGWSEPKTRTARELLEKIDSGGKTLIVLNRDDAVAFKAFRNLSNVMICEPGHLTTYDVLWSDEVIFTTASLGLAGGSGYKMSDDDFVRESTAGTTEPTADAADAGDEPAGEEE